MFLSIIYIIKINNLALTNNTALFKELVYYTIVIYRLKLGYLSKEASFITIVYFNTISYKLYPLLYSVVYSYKYYR